MADDKRQRPAILRYLGIELALLALAGGIYWYKVTYPSHGEPVPITPIAVSDGTAHMAVSSGGPSAQTRPLPVEWDTTSRGQDLTVTPTVSTLTPKDRGATYHLEAELANRTADKALRQLRLVLECLSPTGERIGVDSFEPLSPQQAPLKPGEKRSFAMTSDIDPRTATIRLLVHIRDEEPAQPS